MIDMDCKGIWKNANKEVIEYRFHVVARSDNKALMKAMTEIERFAILMKDVLVEFDYVGMEVEGVVGQYE